LSTFTPSAGRVAAPGAEAANPVSGSSPELFEADGELLPELAAATGEDAGAEAGFDEPSVDGSALDRAFVQPADAINALTTTTPNANRVTNGEADRNPFVPDTG